ncbi:type II toxin-antitoxin system VapC family toxin [Mucilaginibacter gotjawali]|uniref:tRNA(fMet)-specific endonuclease VapC n=2 Tax=Mucilaginibacter gotjawali TaxID=1550579 RepID=A0A839SRS0_9SPHI|nr:type II toxin-antitoxin system VapC family toxin [Mucilaginibacter gotjawali]MBB3059179.1 tRNA(fMet)-specific endonuclease VapC [Mucilaginibacter gotjawali]BAU52235.1 tRNA(fMet)-specific endonuclease VapC [Mucilaginibacter gotjawali]
MNLLLDTNILIYLIKDPSSQLLENVINPNKENILVSVISIGELKSIALQNNWGVRKLQTVETVLDKVSIVEVSESLINTYAEIDAFSQRRNPSYTDYPFSTPRNMGKNDLWIASTAALLGLKVVTTDADFNHLHQIFIEVQTVKPDLFRS